MYFNSNNVKHALFVFGTYNYNENERELMPYDFVYTSLAMFEYNSSNQWELKV